MILDLLYEIDEFQVEVNLKKEIIGSKILFFYEAEYCRS